MKNFLTAVSVLALLAAATGPSWATERPSGGSSSDAAAVAGASSSSKSSATGVGVGVGTGGKSSATGGSASANGDVDVSQGGDKTDNLGLAIAPPSFSYAPGAAVGECVATESYAIGFPLIGGGFGEQTLVMLPACVAQLDATLRHAYIDNIAMAAACQSKFAHKALSDLGVDCDTKPAAAE